MISLNHARLAIVALAVAATLFVGANALLSTQPIDPIFPAVEFPRKVAVPGWQAILEEPDPIRPNTQRYRRTLGEDAILLEMQFIRDLPVHYVRNPKIELRFLPRAHLPLDAGMRYYVSPRAKVVPNERSGRAPDAEVVAGPDGTGWWTADGMVHLTTIVTSAGDAAIVPKAVAHSLYLDHLSVSRIARWLFTREAMPDRRCVLIHFSMPDGPEARTALEDAWTQWRTAHFPSFPPARR